MAWGKGLIDMGRTTEEKISAIEESMPMPMQAADYPYGLQVHLDEKDLEKLGLNGDCEAGDTLEFMAKATVRNVSKHEFNGKHSCSIDLQIEKMAVSSDDEEGAAYAKRYARSK